MYDWFRIVGFIMLLVGGGLLLGFTGPLIRTIAGSLFIMGFLIVALDLMRRSIEKDD